MNAWLRQIHGSNKLYMARSRGEALGLVQDDWVWVESRAGRLKCQVALMEGVNPDTVWTWNAIGKRAGAWGLSDDSPESVRGFLLNHVISEWLPAQEGFRSANADPVTGQAAWYDLRVRVTKAEGGAVTEPHFSAPEEPPQAPKRVDILRYSTKTKA
jgi:anaerobic selenocysteine-containing dehydrogenase